MIIITMQQLQVNRPAEAVSLSQHVMNVFIRSLLVHLLVNCNFVVATKIVFNAILCYCIS